MEYKTYKLNKAIISSVIYSTKGYKHFNKKVIKTISFNYFPSVIFYSMVDAVQKIHAKYKCITFNMQLQ